MRCSLNVFLAEWCIPANAHSTGSGITGYSWGSNESINHSIIHANLALWRLSQNRNMLVCTYHVKMPLISGWCLLIPGLFGSHLAHVLYTSLDEMTSETMSMEERLRMIPTLSFVKELPPCTLYSSTHPDKVPEWCLCSKRSSWMTYTAHRDIES